MKTELTRGPSDDGKIEARLASRFETDLERARRDFPTLRSRAAGSTGRGRIGLIGQRLAVAAIAIVIVGAVGAVGLGLASNSAPGVQPGPATESPANSGDTLPAMFDGQRVYRAADLASFPTSGSFLLGGVVTMPDFVPPCAAPIGMSDAEMKLIPYCSWIAIDGIHLAPVGNFSEARGLTVVVRVHIDDPLAAQCSVANRPECEAAVVVEAVVWRSRWPAVESPTPTPGIGEQSQIPANSAGVASPPYSPPAASSPHALSSGETIGNDGVPTTLGGEQVYRAFMTHTPDSFLMGGALVLDTSCGAASCEFWTLDGIQVGMQANVSSSLSGTIVVAQVVNSRKLAVCANPPCGLADILTVTDIVWIGPPAPPQQPVNPPPALPSRTPSLPTSGT